MPRLLPVGEHLTAAPCDEALRQTYIGQAHIAGTGPIGATCRECRHWHRWKTEPDPVNGGTRRVPAPPPHCSDKHPETPGELKPALCNRPILNRERMTVPHHALACRLFEAADCPPPAKREG